MSKHRASREEEEEIEYAEGWGEEFGRYQHLELEAEHIEEESILTEYDADDFVSCAITSPDSSLPIDLFDFEYSYGYDCHKYFNLCACDEQVVCWAAGSLITFLDVTTMQMWFRRSTTGGTVGNITAHRVEPNYRIAIAEARESDKEPVIIIYTWPQMEMDAVLREGTQNAYSILDFSPDGELLASIGAEPDFNLTIWNWKRHKIMLRTSAFTYGVNNVMFSPYCPGQITTAGLAHIKFWKMSQTFTGLKLKGMIGRFGKTEICDVLGVYPMPDEKVLSGCEWGNVLVWEAGLVKIEVTQRGRKVCHKAPIIQFMLSPAGDEVTTIGRDGCIRAWYWDTVEQADPPEDDQFVEINPVAETCVPDCQIMCLKQQKDTNWFAQDGNGGIWIVDLELDKIECSHKKLATFHAGAVISLAVIRTHPLLITGGEDGAILAYNTETNKLIARYVFSAPISCMLYVPLEVDPTSRTIILGFADGMMRVILVHPEKLLELKKMVEVRIISTLSVHSEDEHSQADVIDMILWLKPHSKKINQISFNTQNTLLVTCSEDSTIFMYRVNKDFGQFTVDRIGFIETPNVIHYMTWKPNKERVVLLCGQVGFIMEAVLPPPIVRKYEEITTFKLDFVSYAETLLKKQYMRHRPFPEEEDLASIDEEALKAAAQESSKDKDDEETEYVGEIQLIESESQLGPTVIWADYCDQGFWVVQEGTGALILMRIGNNKVIKFAPIPGAWEETMHSLKFICDKKYLMIGTNCGYIRIVKMLTPEEDNPEVHLSIWLTNQKNLMKRLKGRKLKLEEKQPIPCLEFYDYYYMQMHDRYRGQILGMEFTNDGKWLYTCGSDGNIFCYSVNFEEPLVESPELPKHVEHEAVSRVKEPSTLDGKIMSHEELKQKEEYDKMMAIANAHKKRVRDQLAELTIEYNKLIKMNKMLPCSQQIDVTLDPRPLEVQEREIDDARKLAIRKVAHQLEASDIGLWKMYSRNIIQLDVFPFTLKAIRDPKVMIRPLRQKNLSKAFWDQLEEVHRKMAEAAARMKRAESTARRAAMKKTSWGPPRVASFLLGLPPHPPHILKKQLRNYYQRLNRHHLQFIEWQEHLSRKPDPNALPPGAAEALREAEATIGNRLLKTDPDYVSPPGHNTQLRLCLCRQEIHDNKRAFNAKVVALRDHKVHLVEVMKKIGDRLQEIRVEIPPKLVKPPPIIPTIDEEIEFPERNLEVKPEPIAQLIKGVPIPRGKKHSMMERKVSLIYPQPRHVQPKVARFVPLADINPLAASWELLKPRPDSKSTPMEIEIRDRRIERHLYEQDMLLKDAEVSIQDFDARVRQLQRERIRVQERSVLLELHLYQMHQEMNVLNRFEAHEDRLAERVYVKLMQVKGVQEQIIDCEQRIEEHKVEKEDINLECEEIQRQFKRLVQDNKFADFLRRIFKKKYRPPRDHDDDESESESESSSSEEEDEGSLDSRDIGPIRLDPNVCPEGCEQEVYNQTYEMRATRHKLEQSMIEQDHLVDLLRKDIEVHQKVKRKLSVQLDKRKRTLKEFMMEKQNCLNDIEQVVVLRYDQIRARALEGCDGPQGLSHTLVFPEGVLTRLRDRVLSLQDEIRSARLRAKINRTHLFRMNIDLREMQRLAEELRAQMRDILSKKLGKPRKVDKTLDDLLRQLARRHKYGSLLRVMPHMLAQFRSWKERHSELEQKYLTALDKYSTRLRLAAALQADVLPQTPMKDPSVMYGAYDINHYKRDVVRLRIVRAQQLQQIQQLEEEIAALRYKPQEAQQPTMPPPPPRQVPSEIWLHSIPPSPARVRHKYFPITPLGSTQKMVYDVNIMKLLYDCLDVMRVSRDDANELLTDLTSALPAVISGEKSRFEVVDELVKKWLLKYGGDPSQYKKQTRAFDALAALADRLIRQHVETLEGATDESNKVMDELETALKDVAQDQTEQGVPVEPLCNRLAPALAALFHAAGSEDLGTEETMTSLINSLMMEDVPLTIDDIDQINVEEVVRDIKHLGVRVPEEEIERVVILAVECLQAQLMSKEEAKAIEDEVARALLQAAQHTSMVAQPEQRVSMAPLDTKSRSKISILSKTSRLTSSSKTGPPRSKVSIGSRVVLGDKKPETSDKISKPASPKKPRSVTVESETAETPREDETPAETPRGDETPQEELQGGAETPGDAPQSDAGAGDGDRPEGDG